MLQTKTQRKSKHILYTVYIYIYFFFENPAFYETMWKNTVELERP